MSILELDLSADYIARRQFRPFHERSQRWAIIVAHRRAGKTVATINDLIRRAMTENKKDGRYAIIGPYYNQIKDISWTYLKDYTKQIVQEEPREAELSVLLLNGSRIRLYGADNPDRLRGLYLDGVVLDEFGDMVPSLWSSVIRPALSDRQGWAVFIGTPKGKNKFWEIWRDALKQPDEWFHLMLQASETGILSQKELDDARRMIPQDEYDQEYECSFEAAIQGAFYADELRTMAAEGRIAPLEVDKSIRVHTSWDLGVSDSTAIWFIQCVGRERRLVDYYEGSGVGLDHYAQVLHDKRRERGWVYADHHFPFDISHREWTTGKSRLQALAALGLEATVVREIAVLDGINAVRRMLGRTWIDPITCERGLEALRQYRRDYDENLKDFKKNPRHDWASHGADALRYFAVGFDDAASSGVPRRRPLDDIPSGRTHWSA